MSYIINYGAEIGRSLAGLGDAIQQGVRTRAIIDARRKAEKLEEARALAADAFQNNDMDEISRLSILHPELSQDLQKQIGFKNEQTQKNMSETIMGVLSNPENADRYFQDRIAMLEANGSDPDITLDAYEEYKRDPEGFKKNATATLAYLNPKAYEAFKATQTSPQERTANYQYAGKGMIFDPITGELNLSPEYQQIVKQQATQEAEKKAGGTPTESQVVAEEQNLNAKNATYDALRQVNDLLESDIGSISGFSENFPTLQPSSKDIVNTAKNLQNILTLDNMGIMKGVLTDKDMEVIANAASGLSISDNGISGTEKEIRKQLQFIKRKLEDKLGGYTPDYADEGQKEQLIAPPSQVSQAQSGYEASAIAQQAQQPQQTTQPQQLRSKSGIVFTVK